MQNEPRPPAAPQTQERQNTGQQSQSQRPVGTHALRTFNPTYAEATAFNAGNNIPQERFNNHQSKKLTNAPLVSDPLYDKTTLKVLDLTNLPFDLATVKLLCEGFSFTPTLSPDETEDPVKRHNLEIFHMKKFKTELNK